VTESIVIKNLAGTVVRRLLPPTVRNPGTHDDFFNGRNDAGELLPDGPYFYVATVTSDGHTLVWDQTNVLHWGQNAHTNELNIQPYDPFNNQPLTFEYFFHQPARVSVGTSTVDGAFVGNCDAPNDTFFCPANKIWQESGAHTYTWWGVDHTGSYRVIHNIGIVSIVNEANPFPENAAILFGSKPKLEHVKVFPPVFGPEVGMQTVEFDLTTLNSAPASVKVEFVNLTTKSTLRTIVEKQPPGHSVIEWDGRADSGMHVAPGYYNVIVTVTDAIGNVVRSGILTEIQY
jgi:flagellar hook assembly protein FlgD